MDMNLMHSNYVFNYRKRNLYFLILICLLKVKSMSLIPNICRLWNSKFPSVCTDVSFSAAKCEQFTNCLLRKNITYITVHMPSTSTVKVKISSESHWDCFDATLLGACQNVCCRQIQPPAFSGSSPYMTYKKNKTLLKHEFICL